MTCKLCKHDHKVKNTGALTVCERRSYMAYGATTKDKSGNKQTGFGIGNERFQFEGAK